MRCSLNPLETCPAGEIKNLDTEGDTYPDG